MIQKKDLPKEIRKYFKHKETKTIKVKGYISHLCDIFDEVKRVLSPYGSVWVNLGDKYIKGEQQYVPHMFAIEMKKRGWISKSTIIWHKESCLSGGTKVYVKSQTGNMPMLIKDLVKLKPETVKLWDGKKWNQIEKFIENKNPTNKLFLELRNGQWISCTGNHVFPTQRGEITASDIKEGDILQKCNLPDSPYLPECEYIPDEIGWLIGLFIAEGNKDKNSIKLSGHRNETSRRLKAIIPICEKYGASYNVYDSKKTNASYITIHSKIIKSIMETFVHGEIAKNKGITTKSYQRSNNFLRNLLEGYLSGDGHYDKSNNRQRFNFTRNDKWASDLRVICSRLGYSIRILKTFSYMGDKKYPSYQADLKVNRGEHGNKKEDGEVIKIKKGYGRKYWDIVLKYKPHLFALDSGILAHNCVPEATKRRFCNDYEYFFFFVKDNKKYHFEMQYEPFAESTKKLKPGKKRNKWINKVISGQQAGRHQRTTWLYKPVFYKLKDDFEQKPEVMARLKEMKLI